MDYGEVLTTAIDDGSGQQYPALSIIDGVAQRQIDGPGVDVWAVEPGLVVCRIKATDAAWAQIEADTANHTVLWREPIPLDGDGNEMEVVF